MRRVGEGQRCGPRAHAGCRLLIRGAAEIRGVNVPSAVERRRDSHPRVAGNYRFPVRTGSIRGSGHTVSSPESAGRSWS